MATMSLSTRREYLMRIKKKYLKADKEQKSLFRDFVLKSPFQSVKDIFCLRLERMVDSYRKISLQGLELTVPGVLPRNKVELRLYPDLKTGITEVRFWHEGYFTESQRVKSADLPIVQF